MYTAHLLNEMRTPGAPIEQVFKRVRQRVFAETAGRQVPWDASSLQGEFYFTPTAPVEGIEEPKAAGPVPQEIVPPVSTVSPSVGPPEALPQTEQRTAMLVIPAGTYLMGSSASEAQSPPNNDEQQHEVQLTRGFWLGQTEVTQGQWERVMGTNPSAHQGADLPVEQLSWFDAVTYCNRLSQAEKVAACYKIKGDKVEWVGGLSCLGYRLPTEAEWEHAAREGQRTFYVGSNDVDAVAWYAKNSSGETHPVGKKAANGRSLYDLSGNVWEWVWDFYAVYPNKTVLDPIGPDYGVSRVIRSGSWGGDAVQMRIAERGSSAPGERNRRVGFRLARTLPR